MACWSPAWLAGHQHGLLVTSMACWSPATVAMHETCYNLLVFSSSALQGTQQVIDACQAEPEYVKERIYAPV
jgi:hypothetical protein